MQALASADFAIDPTDPHMSRVKDPKGLIAKVSDKRKQAARPGAAQQNGMVVKEDEPAAQGEFSVKSLVSSLKRKHKQLANDRLGGQKNSKAKSKKHRLKCSSGT
jgi:hypothetical protein